MFRKKTYLLLALVMVLLFSLAGCQGEAPKDPAGTEDNEVTTDEQETAIRDRHGRPDHELVVSMGSRIPHEFDPKDRYGLYNESHITHSTLLKKTETLDIVPDFAKEWSISEDGLVWTFDLHDDFKFSNGEPVTAEDVKFSYEMLIEDGQHWDVGFIKEIKIVDDHAIEFHLEEPRSTFTAQLTEVPIVPAKYYDDQYKYNPIGSGPYMVVEYTPEEQAIFEVNPYWHGEEPYFKKWTWVCLDENAALAALKAGEVDMIYAIPEFADEEIDGCKLFDIESNDVRGLSMPYVSTGVITDSPDGYPVGNDVTSDPAIRKALNIGLNREQVVDVVLNGHGKPAYSVIDGMPWWNEETAIEDNRIDEAKELLEDAGWIEGVDGVREKDGLKAKFQLYYPTNDVVRTNVAIEAADQAKALGIEIELVGSNWDEMTTKSHEVALLYAGGRHHPNQFYESHDPERAGHGWTNITYYNNPKVMEYMHQAMTATDLNEANKYWKLAQWDGEVGASTLGDIANVWLIRLNHTYMGDSRINVGEQGVHSHGHDWALLHNIGDWTWDSEAR